MGGGSLNELSGLADSHPSPSWREYPMQTPTVRLVDSLTDNVGQLIDEGIIEFTGDGSADPFQVPLQLTAKGEHEEKHAWFREADDD